MGELGNCHDVQDGVHFPVAAGPLCPPDPLLRFLEGGPLTNADPFYSFTAYDNGIHAEPRITRGSAWHQCTLSQGCERTVAETVLRE
jgi:hypothetical protein